MEVAGLGKLRPNMMMIGFQEKWYASPDDADEYVRTLQSAFDLHLSVGVFRIQSGFDLTSIGFTNENVLCAFIIVLSIDEKEKWPCMIGHVFR